MAVTPAVRGSDTPSRPRDPPLPGEEHPGEEVEEPGGELRIPGCQAPEPAREGEHPLANRDGREDVLDQVLGGVLHPSRVAGRATPRLAREGDQPLEATVGTVDSREAVGQDPAAEIGAEIALDVGGKSPAGGAAVAGGGEEGLQPLADDLV